MRRLFWIGVGATVAVVVVTKARAVVHRYSPAGVAEQLDERAGQIGTGLRGARAVFRSAMAQREAELYDVLVGDVDVDQIREDRAERKAARSARADAPWPEDPDDLDGDLPYSFF